MELSERIGGVDSDRERLRQERDNAIRAAHEAGLTVREIARLAGVSHQRVHQVISG
jgi:IS30 family transposase